MSKFKGGPICVTLQLSEDLQEVIELHEGDDINSIASGFCQKYGINSAVQEQIVEEFKRQIRQQFGDSSVDAFLNPPHLYEGSFKNKPEAKERMVSSNEWSNAENQYKQVSENEKQEIKQSKNRNPYKDSHFYHGRDAKADSKLKDEIPNKSLKTSEIQDSQRFQKSAARSDLESPTHKLKQFLRSKEEEKRKTKIPETNLAISSQRDDLSPEKGQASNKKPESQYDSKDPFSYQPRENPYIYQSPRHDPKPQTQPSSNPFENLLSKGGFLTNKTPPKNYQEFGEEDRMSNITHLNKTDNGSDIQSIINIERDINTNRNRMDGLVKDSMIFQDDGHLKEIFEKSGYFKKDQARKSAQNEKNDRGTDGNEDSRSSNQGKGNRGKEKQRKVNKVWDTSPNKLIPLSSNTSPIKTEAPHDRFKKVSTKKTTQRMQNQQQHYFEQAHPITMRNSRLDKDEKPLYHSDTNKRANTQRDKVFEDDFGYDDNEEAIEMRRTYEDTFKKTKTPVEKLTADQIPQKKNTKSQERKGKEKQKRSKTNKNRKNRNDENEMEEMKLFQKLENEVKQIEDKGNGRRDDTFEKKTSILTFAKNSVQSKVHSTDPKHKSEVTSKQKESNQTENEKITRFPSAFSRSLTPSNKVRSTENPLKTDSNKDPFSLPETKTVVSSQVIDRPMFGSKVDQKGGNPFAESGQVLSPNTPNINLRTSQRFQNLRKSKLQTENDASGLQQSKFDQSELKRSKVITPIDPDTYQKLMKKSVSQTRLAQKNLAVEKETAELRNKPEINTRSKNLNQRLNRGNYDTVHERLFYKGIETMKKKEEIQQIEFVRSYPFKPITNNGPPPQSVKPEDIDKLVYSYKEKDMILTRKKYISDTFDPNDGKKLYTPRINPSQGVIHKLSFKEVQELEKEKKEYLQQLRQIFDFLDKGFEGFVYAQKIDYENIHPELAGLLKDVLHAVIKSKSRLSFGDFFHLIDEKNLDGAVIEIFDCLNRQPLINPRPVKDKPFKFA